MSGPLKGIKVLDFTHARAGPHCAMMLGDMGADVIKIERPGGEIGRLWGPTIEGERIDFMSVNRNKRSVVLDLENADDLALAWALIADTDVVIQNLRPGVMDAFGLGADAVLSRHPSVIYCSANGYGPEGPLAMEPSYDNVIQAYSGLMSITGTDLSGPVRSGLPLADLLTGVFSTVGILAALCQRQTSGLGQHVQASLLQSLVSLMSFHGLTYLLKGTSPGVAGNHHPIMAPGGLYQVGDGQIVIQISSEREWKRFCEAVDHPKWVEDPRFKTNDVRVANRPVMNELIEAQFAKKTRSEWIERLRQARVPSGAVNTVGEALETEQVRANDLVVPMEHPRLGTVPVLGFPLKFSRTPCDIRRAPPDVGQHTEEIRNARKF